MDTSGIDARIENALNKAKEWNAEAARLIEEKQNGCPHSYPQLTFTQGASTSYSGGTKSYSMTVQCVCGKTFRNEFKVRE